MHKSTPSRVPRFEAIIPHPTQVRIATRTHGPTYPCKAVRTDVRAASIPRRAAAPRSLAGRPRRAHPRRGRGSARRRPPRSRTVRPATRRRAPPFCAAKTSTCVGVLRRESCDSKPYRTHAGQDGGTEARTYVSTQSRADGRASGWRDTEIFSCPIDARIRKTISVFTWIRTYARAFLQSDATAGHQVRLRVEQHNSALRTYVPTYLRT